ncbi:hypothetical protein ACFORJ_02545 [Corynebacterium hansenii]|uniref:PE domain-containing protein n=1 Tax=Corynebacterium hansenii TaxID=394964 RepID=A0ABV7ZMU1_9CORY|nr:hypothetical protein [Corynebacterium hansenii]WJY99122.1 hypothetical protein CHAN_02455 [Corynebacterium hansenii]
MPHPPISPPPAAHLAADPAALAESAAMLRGLVPAAAPSLADARVPASAPDSGIGRFLAALSAALTEQEGRVAALGRYAGGAAGALDRFAGEVADAETSSSARFDRDGFDRDGEVRA